MKSIRILFLLFAFAIASTINAQKKSPVDYVNPLMGTQSTYALSTGNTYPAIAAPWGMNFWTPQTGKEGDGWTYSYTANKIRGLKQTHQPSPWINDYGQFSLFATSDRVVFDENERESWFSHKSETATPYYYSVYLADYDVTAELSPTSRAALFRFTFPQTDSATIVVDAFDKGSYVKIIPEARKIVGYSTRNCGGVPDNFKNFFVIEFDEAFDYFGAVTNNKINFNTTVTETSHAGAVVGFKTVRGQQIHARVASSFISIEQAERNLNELGNLSFNELRQQNCYTWNNVLGKIEVNDDNVDRLRTFYTCLYRSVLFPRSFYEIDSTGNPVHYSPYNGKICKGYLFTDTGFWDTFRSLFPLLNLVYPSMNAMMQEGLVNAYLESGFLPEWASPGHRDCMVGNNSASVVADAYVKGVRGYDAEKLWEAVVYGANHEHPTVNSTGRKGFAYYNKLGYVPYNVGINENVARTLEYAYDDWCIYQFGKALGKSEKALRPYKERALNYKNVFDKSTNLMRGKNEDGTFQSPFNPLKWGDAFTEGNSWHYTWSVFHDIDGLIRLMGGNDVFCQMLDSVFNLPPVFDESYYGQVIHEIREMQIMNMGNYAHGNQPIQHMIYLYNFAGQPWKAQQHVREVMDKLYAATPDGYCGDEDNGQTSAWYVFSAMGFYPVCPATNEYVLGAPLFKDVTLHLENGKTVEIVAPANDDTHIYINDFQINGKSVQQNYVTHQQLNAGGTLRFEMAEKPNKLRGRNAENAPYSFSKTLQKRVK